MRGAARARHGALPGAVRAGRAGRHRMSGAAARASYGRRAARATGGSRATACTATAADTGGRAGRSLRVRVGARPTPTASRRRTAADASARRATRSGSLRGSPRAAPAREAEGDTGDATREVRLSWSASAAALRVASPAIASTATGCWCARCAGWPGVDRNLAPATSYRFTVAAIDTQGYMSASTAPVVGHDRAAGRRRRAAPMRSCWRRPARASATSSAITGRSARSTRRTSTAAPRTGRSPGATTRSSRAGPSCAASCVLPRFNCQDAAPLHRILTDSAVRSRDPRRGSSTLVREHGYDGINIDFENGAASDRDALTSFVSDLGDAAARDREAAVGRGLGEVRAHDHGPLRLLRLRGAGSRRRPRVRHELGLALVDVGAGRARRHGAVPQGRRLRGLDAEQVAVRARHSPVRDGLAERRRPGQRGDRARVRRRARTDRATRRAARCSIPLSDAWVFTYTEQPACTHEVWYADADHDRAAGAAGPRPRASASASGGWAGRTQRIWSDPLIAPGMN